ncbi:hypothetical protein SAMN05192582_11523 [Bacteroides ovatus]|uniref:Uncharacterized protein n=1 Tax=Bacteroides ovatus TaxID=28116 RepID=A0A1G8RRB3_BACOV|nr:hypothetical protein SAMN05192582_11523 [Bacteroides ovatus]
MGSAHNKLYVRRFIAFKIRVYFKYLFNANVSIDFNILKTSITFKEIPLYISKSFAPYIKD